jgi:hypothetical protein
MFAVAIDHVETARTRVARVLGTAWVIGCLSFSHFEAYYAFLHSHALSPGFLDRPPRRIINSPGRFLHALTDYDHDAWFFYFPEPDLEVFTHDEGVALGNLQIGSAPLAGVASMPLGRRSLAFMSEDVAKDAARVLEFADRYAVRYVYWRADEPAPAGLSSVSRHTTLTVGAWRLFDLGLRGPGVARPLVAK